MMLHNVLCSYTTQGRTLHDGLVRCTDTIHNAVSRRLLIPDIGRAGETAAMEVVLHKNAWATKTPQSVSNGMHSDSHSVSHTLT